MFVSAAQAVQSCEISSDWFDVSIASIAEPIDPSVTKIIPTADIQPIKAAVAQVVQSCEIGSDWLPPSKASITQPIDPSVTKTKPTADIQPIKAAVVSPNVRSVKNDDSEKEETEHPVRSKPRSIRVNKSRENITDVEDDDEMTENKEKEFIDNALALLSVSSNTLF